MREWFSGNDRLSWRHGNSGVRFAMVLEGAVYLLVLLTVAALALYWGSAK
jgi:hypothetical protein